MKLNYKLMDKFSVLGMYSIFYSAPFLITSIILYKLLKIPETLELNILILITTFILVTIIKDKLNIKILKPHKDKY